MKRTFVMRTNFMQFIILSSCFLLSCNLQVRAHDLLKEWCSNSENYTANSQFQTNLNLLLRSLLSNGARDGFFNTSTGAGSDTVYGLVQCGGDISIYNCRNCLNHSFVGITQRCPRRKEASLRYNQCILRYSNQRFFSQVDYNLWALRSENNVSEVDTFNQQLESLMNNLSRTAASRPNRYDSGSIGCANFGNIYGMAQCNRDLTPTGCQSCLQNTISHISSCCNSKRGVRIFSTTCYIRYEIYHFVESTPASPPPPETTNNTESGDGTGKGKSTNVVVIIVLPVFASLILLSVCGVLISKTIVKKRRKTKTDENYEQELRTTESLQFNFKMLREATNNFSEANKLGKGGFGIVYKGTLLDGQKIAVKRLSSNSGQGVEEFNNEVLLIVKLQHRNLVKLLGFCLEGNEKLLVYEFASNASLDHYLFDPTKCTYLSWERRHMIIGGIARGLLYLHEDSRYRIIHRDLKASNVLLDENMEPKISDFGMARLFKVNQNQGSTARIVGTYGYMAPEYAMHGQFSVKSDVFSFGVLVLEIITGQKNKVFFQSKHAEDLLSYAWRHWGEGRALELIEPGLKGQYSISEVMRDIHIALLCVQEDVALRPRMATVVHMLETKSVTLVSPSTPAFFVNSREQVNKGEVDSANLHSANEVSLTEMHPR